MVAKVVPESCQRTDVIKAWLETKEEKEIKRLEREERRKEKEDQLNGFLTVAKLQKIMTSMGERMPRK